MNRIFTLSTIAQQGKLYSIVIQTNKRVLQMDSSEELMYQIVLNEFCNMGQIRFTEPVSIRECLRAHDQRKPPRPPLNLGRCNQFNIGWGHKGAFSKHYQDFLQTYKNPFDYFRKAWQIYYHHENLEYLLSP